ncbi:MAG TPA: GntR family transcriptional regulator [Bacillota bacterium]|nr:GntR family transcriptional regulator [Bacillota bacterium]
MKLTLKKGPLYIQVYEILKDRIINGEYPKNTFIPSEQELKDEFNVSVITIRRAVEELARQGSVEKRSGVGTTVLDNYAVSRLSKGQRFSEHLIEEGFNLQKKQATLSIIDIPGDSCLRKHFGEQCYCIERLYTLNEQPYIHFKHHISLKLDIPDEQDKLLESLYEILYRQGVKFNRFRDEFGIEMPEKYVADLLGVDYKPLLQRQRFSYDINGYLVEYSEAFYNTDIHKYVVNFDV